MADGFGDPVKTVCGHAARFSEDFSINAQPNKIVLAISHGGDLT